MRHLLVMRALLATRALLAMRALLVLVGLAAIGAVSPARAADYNFTEPTDIRTILITISTSGNVNLLIGTGVEGLTRYVARNKTPEQAVVEAAVGAGYTVRLRDNLLAVRLKGISPQRVDENPPRYFRADERVSARFLGPRPARTLLNEVAGQMKVPYRLHKLAKGEVIANFRDVHPRTFLNVFCEAMGYGWGTTRNVLVVAQWHRAQHYIIEMGVDGRTE